MTHTLDAVILAGGKSERLNGIVPPYHKPFIVIGGKSLLVNAVDAARAVGAERVVIVATGENALPVSQLVGHMPYVDIVLASGGTARALHTGLRLCTYQRVLVLMSDNVHGPDDVAKVCEHRYAIGVRQVTCAEAARFTRREYGQWVEGPTVTNTACTSTDPHTSIWCGPLLVQRQRGLDLLPTWDKIGPLLGDLAPVFELVPVETIDVGIPAVVAELTE